MENQNQNQTIIQVSQTPMRLKGNFVSRDQVANCPAPEGKKRHVPLQYGLVLEKAIRHINSIGFKITEENHLMGSKKDGFDMTQISIFTLENDGIAKDFQGFKRDFQLGILNNNSRQKPLTIFSGNRVSACLNLSIFAEQKDTTKHTTFIWSRIDEFIQKGIFNMIQKDKNQLEKFALYRTKPLNDQKEIDHLVLNGMRKGVYGSTQIKSILNEYENPSFSEFKEEKNLWGFFNAVTHSVKNLDFVYMPDRTMRLQRVIDVHANVA